LCSLSVNYIIYIFRPQGQTVGSAAGCFPSAGSRVMVVVSIRVSVIVNRVRVRMADKKRRLSCTFIPPADEKNSEHLLVL